MSKDKDEFNKKFDEIINSEDLQKISEEFQTEINMGSKELILIQQSLSDVISHISEILLERLNGSFGFVFTGDTVYHNLLGSLYKIAEDFNEVIVEYFTDAILDDDEDDDGLDNNEGEGSNGPF